jgi:enoyl-CoA hydratase
MRSIYEGFLRVARSTLPTIAAVNGAAVGAGINLALGCDVRVAAERARFDSRFGNLGIHPGGGHTWLLHRALGPQGAHAVALFGEVLNGARAAEIGLAWRCVADDALLETAIALGAQAAAMPRPLSMRIKQSLRAAPGHADHAAAVDYELEPQLWSVQQPFFAERLAAMRQKITSRPKS